MSEGRGAPLVPHTRVATAPPPAPLSHSCAPCRRMALNVQLYLRIDRADLAEKALAALTAADDEAALTQLSTGLVYLALVRAWVMLGGG